MKIYTYSEIKKFARQIENKEILMRKDSEEFSVAHELAWRADTTNWSTDDLEILSLYSGLWKRTVEDLLEEKRKI